MSLDRSLDANEDAWVALLPPGQAFVNQLTRRVTAAFPSTILSITKAIGSEERDAQFLISFMRNKLTWSGFLIGCAAEEIASVASLLAKVDEQRFVREVVEALRVPAKPLPAKQIGPSLRRLIREFKHHPTQTRTGMVRYILQLNQLDELAEKMAADPAKCLAIECTVTTDGVAGFLWEQLTEKPKKHGRKQSRPAAAWLQLQL